MAAVNYPTTGGYVSPNTSAYSQPVTTPIVWVDNEMYARNAYVAPGSTGFFMERQNQRFYVKSTALSGEVASFKIFEFNEVIPAPPAQPEVESQPQYVTTDTFTKTMEELKQLINSKYSKE